MDNMYRILPPLHFQCALQIRRKFENTAGVLVTNLLFLAFISLFITKL